MITTDARMNVREISTVIAALRERQARVYADHMAYHLTPADLDGIADDGGVLTPLGDDEIDQLIHRLNSGFGG